MELFLSQNDIAYIEKSISYNFSNKSLLQQAFTRKSFAQEHHEYESNEVLEFYGDAIIDLVVTKRLYDSFSESPRQYSNDLFYSQKDEGELSKIRAGYVRKDFLANCMDRLRLNQYLLLGKSDEKNNVKNSASVKEDLFEAIIGAIAVDSNWNIEKLKTACIAMLKIGEYKDDYITLLSEWCDDWNFPEPKFSTPEIYPFYHSVNSAKKYQCTVRLDNSGFSFNEKGDGYSPQEAKMEAAKLAYEKCLAKEDELIQSQMLDDIGGQIVWENSVSQLNKLYMKGYFSKPEYDEKKSTDDAENEIWRCECFITEYKNNRSIGKERLKKDAKKSAAYDMLCFIFDLDTGSENDGYYNDDYDYEDDD